MGLFDFLKSDNSLFNSNFYYRLFYTGRYQFFEGLLGIDEDGYYLEKLEKDFKNGEIFQDEYQERKNIHDVDSFENTIRGYAVTIAFTLSKLKDIKKLKGDFTTLYKTDDDFKEVFEAASGIVDIISQNPTFSKKNKSLLKLELFSCGIFQIENDVEDWYLVKNEEKAIDNIKSFILYGEISKNPNQLLQQLILTKPDRFDSDLDYENFHVSKYHLNIQSELFDSLDIFEGLFNLSNYFKEQGLIKK